MIDLHTVSKHDFGKVFELLSIGQMTEEEVRANCRIAKEYNMRSYMLAPFWLPVLVDEFKGTDINPGCGAGFPLGTEPPKAKAAAIECCVQLGAKSLDFSMNYSALKAGRTDIVAEELDMFVDAAEGNETKVIIEVCMLTDDEAKRAVEMIADRGINWVKSSTGQFAGPTMHQVDLIMTQLKGTDVRLKVSGVKAPRPQNAYMYIKAGVEIIGSQGAVEIIDGLELHRKLGLI
ncbi:MAG: deoxyribose-phosphate aldolase [Oscillospiraceae bacterium]